MAFEARHVVTNEVTLTLPPPQDESPSPRSNLEDALVASGLFPKEARAMVDTWRDAWFEEGTRVFYVVPPAFLESVLPLDIEPRPADVVRAFVGRMEVVTPATQRAVADAIAGNDRATLARYGRFLQPIGDRLVPAAASADRPALQRRLQSVYASSSAPIDRCR
jgi:hypothetical protein